MNIQILFILFMIYAVIGWAFETIICSIMDKKFANRGFFIGPYLPIFGIGAILITFILSNYQKDILVLFIMSAVLGAVLEYISSYLLEKIFNTRWWNYEIDKFNLNGRVCLSATICFGALGVILIEVLNPFFIETIKSIPQLTLNIIFIILLVIFITDMIVSITIISKIKSKNFGKSKDTTEEVTKKVREALKNGSIFSKRLINAFPDLKISNRK